MPGLGSTGGKFQISAGWRYAYADKSYFDNRVNHDFTRLWGPREQLSILDVTTQYRLNSRIRLVGTVPIVMNHFSLLLPPLGIGRGQRQGWGAAGIGDVSLYAQSFLLKPTEHPFENISLGIGIKAPTGYWGRHRIIPSETGSDFQSRAIYPPAIYPGDGGVGILFGYNLYKILRKPALLRGVTLYSTGLYLSNPRDTNGTPSIIESLGVPLTANFFNRVQNSVADTYALSAGAAMPVPYTWKYKNLRGLRMRGSINWEGLRKYDLFGPHNGFRQPGYALAAAPGITYQIGRNLFIMEVPIVFNRHIDPGATNLPGIPVVTKSGAVLPGPFNPARQMGLVAPASISLRYVRTL